MLVGLICLGKAPCRYTPGAARTRPDVFYLCYEMRMFGAFHHNLLFFWPCDVLDFNLVWNDAVKKLVKSTHSAITCVQCKLLFHCVDTQGSCHLHLSCAFCFFACSSWNLESRRIFASQRSAAGPGP